MEIVFTFSWWLVMNFLQIPVGHLNIFLSEISIYFSCLVFNDLLMLILMEILQKEAETERLFIPGSLCKCKWTNGQYRTNLISLYSSYTYLVNFITRYLFCAYLKIFQIGCYWCIIMPMDFHITYVSCDFVGFNSSNRFLV